MATESDSIWRPDYAGPEPVRSEPRGFADVVDRPSVAARSRLEPRSAADGRAGSPLTAPPSGAPSGRSAWRPGVAVLVVAVAAAGVFVVTTGSDDKDNAASDDASAETDLVDRADDAAPTGASGTDSSSASTDSGEVATLPGRVDGIGADPRRLPRAVTERWSRPLVSQDVGSDTAGVPDSDQQVDTVVRVVDQDHVVVVWGVGRSGDVVDESRLSVFDLADGSPVWSLALPGRPTAFGIVGARDGVLLIESSLSDRRIAGYVLGDGTERWVRAEAPGQFDVIGAASGFELVRGSPLVARRSIDAAGATLFIDPMTGEQVGRLDGEVIGDGNDGEWHTRVDGSFRTHDLSAGYSSGRTVASIFRAEGRGAVVDGRVVQPDGDRIYVAQADETVTLTTAVVDEDTHDVDLPGAIASVSAMSGSTMLVSGSGEVVGAELVGNVIRPVWRRAGAAQELYPTDDGHLILLATRGGAQLEIVDGTNGRTVYALTLAAGVTQALDVAGDGFVTRRTSRAGPLMAGVDLDGKELWTLPGGGPVALGDGVVVRVEPTPGGDGGPRLVAYAPPAATG